MKGLSEVLAVHICVGGVLRTLLERVLTDSGAGSVKITDCPIFLPHANAALTTAQSHQPHSKANRSQNLLSAANVLKLSGHLNSALNHVPASLSGKHAIDDD